MTVMAEELQAWQSQPGWGIKAELMPPEVLATRRAKVVRRLAFLGLAALLVLCTLAWGATLVQSRDASSKLRAENARTIRLQNTRDSFDNVTRIKAAISQAQTQIAGLMGSDAKIEKLMTDIATGVPQGLLFSQISITMADPSAAGATAATPTGGSVLDTSGTPEIGSVSITAVTPRLTDVAAYLDTLSKVTGVVKPYPGAETTDKKGTQFSVTFGISNALLTHNYDKVGGN